MNDNTDYTGVEKSPLVKIVELQADLDRTRKELDRVRLKGVEDVNKRCDVERELEELQTKGYMQKLWVLLKTLECQNIEELMEQPSPYLVRVALEITESAKLNKKLLAQQCDLARESEVETERWRTMAQRHNPSGCCCQIDDNNGDPKMVEPCAFHAEWRDLELGALRGKVQAIRDFDCGAWLATTIRGFDKRRELIGLLDDLYKTGLRAAMEKGEG